ncbi:MAG: glycosyltransferase family 4 protein [Candidatus Binatus sp.]|uniref:glycosyltransferase family 4 protein n=1 Tax=Candidatus Binatus sp. TaxID=2811406 RepID=UPI00271B48EC|nr:glycosyltransferase family 4 protein [Candidatus Binatus sp.]MDO8432684.1 glycosyltransferase family 4 protein [Candidatus Binatus sp.]
MSRILIVAYTHYLRDGRVRRHAEALAARGDSVDVISLDDAESGVHRGVNVVGLKIARYRGDSRSRYVRSYLEFFMRAIATALRLNSRGRYDAAIVCTMPDAAILSALPLRAFGARLVLDVHDTMPELYRDKFGGRRGALGARLLMLEERFCASLADRVLAVHKPHADRLAQAGIPERKIRVVPNSPDPAIFQSSRVRAAEREMSIVCHGTVTSRLGLDIALQAIDLLRGRLADLKLLIIGEGDHLAEVKALSERLKLDGLVTFKPPVPIEALPSMLGEVSVGLVPNRATEATQLMLPVKLLEYMILGIPVICARLRTIEYYFPGDALQYFEAGNVGQLAAAIELLYHHPERRSALARRARQAARTLSWDHERDVFFDAIDSVLPERARNRDLSKLASSSLLRLDPEEIARKN